jgi:light-harvesting complex 1 beta chain
MLIVGRSSLGQVRLCGDKTKPQGRMDAARFAESILARCRDAIRIRIRDDVPIAIGGKCMSSLTADEAREFHAAFMRGKLGFYAIAIFAHACVWVWRPWF